MAQFMLIHAPAANVVNGPFVNGVHISRNARDKCLGSVDNMLCLHDAKSCSIFIHCISVFKHASISSMLTYWKV